VVVSPDAAGVVRARALAKRIEADLAIIDKRRPRANVAEVMHIIGEVDGRTCVIMDDMVDTANTLCQAASALREHGAVKVMAYCTHPVLSGRAVERINGSGTRRGRGHRHHPARRPGGVQPEDPAAVLRRRCWRRRFRAFRARTR